MKLYYSSGACSMSCHIALEEMGFNYEALKVDFDANTNVSVLEKLNPLDAVPTLVTDDGKTLTQNTAILEFLADKKPESHLLAPVGSWERAETLKWLSIVSSDLHKAFNPLFMVEHITQNETGRADIRKFGEAQIMKILSVADQQLAGKDYLLGKQFTVADAYLFVVAGWSKYVNIKTDEFKNLTAFMSRVYQRPAVQKVMKTEGLLN